MSTEPSSFIGTRRIIQVAAAALAFVCVNQGPFVVSASAQEGGETFATVARKSLFSRRLTRGQRVTVRAARCQLELRRNTVRQMRFRCTGSTGPAAPRRVRSGTQLLRSGDSVTIAARGCFLNITSLTTRQARVVCSATRPTATPTPTPTGTPAITATPTNTPTPNANALITNNQLITFNTGNVAGAPTPSPLTGVTAGESIVSVDRRPQNGVLYGLGYNGTNGTVQLYAISPESNIATAVGSVQSLADASGTSTRIGVDASTQIEIDFNPTVDRLRVVTSNGQNFRMNPNTGAIVDTDAGASGNQPDSAINGATTTVQGAAYTNNNANASLTTLYTMDASTDGLYLQNPANAGTQTSKVALSTPIDAVTGFDIPPGIDVTTSNAAVAAGTGFALLRQTNTSQDTLAQVDLVSGAVTALGPLGSTTTGASGLAIQQPAAGQAIALTSDGAQLMRFRLDAPDNVLAAVAITGVASGETLVGIDFRPSTGELMGLGVDPTANDGTLYRIDPQTGAVTAIGSEGLVAFVDASAVAIDLPATTVGYGFDFNPVADRIRVVTGSGLNFRINPSTGAGVDSDSVNAGVQPDTALNGTTTSAVEVGYTNSFAQSVSGVTTLYALDSASDSVFIQNPPNAGTATTLIPVLLGGSTLDFSEPAGFDLASSVRVSANNGAVTSGSAFAALNTAAGTHLYSINLVSGVATNIGTIGAGTTAVRGLTISRVTAE